MLSFLLGLQSLLQPALAVPFSSATPVKEIPSGWPVIDSVYEACATNNFSGRRLCDPGNILSQEDATILEEKILRLEQYSVCDTDNQGKDVEEMEGDVQMAVVIVPKMDLSSTATVHFSTMDEAAEFHARSIHNMLGVGNVLDPSDSSTKKKCRNLLSSLPSSSSPSISTGILLFISVQDRSMYISTSNAVQPILTPKRLDIVLETMKEYLRQRDYDKAIQVCVHQIEYYFNNRAPKFLEIYGEYIFFASILLVLGLWHKRNERKSREYAAVHSRLSQIDRDRALVLMGKYTVTSCPICLEDFQQVSSEEEASNSTSTNTNHNNDRSAPVEKYIGSDGKPIQVLRCGHAFDETCLRNWISRGTNVQNCPICKEPIAGPIEPTTTISSTRSDTLRRRDISTTTSSQEISSLDDNISSSSSWFEHERTFRLRRLMVQYPRYVNSSQLTRWTNPNYNGSLAQDQDFVRSNPSTANGSGGVSHNTQSGGWSSGGGGGGGFGGGSSGGGRGGGW
jgi:uncharacterized membrane protein YgcG